MFNKDLLLVDIEATGLDPHKNEIIQIAAILLDKKTLREKKSFVSYVRPENWRNRNPESMAINNISFAQVKHSPTLKATLASLHKKFDLNKVIIANYGPILDIEFLKAAYRKLKKPYPFEYHVFNIWPLCYTYAAKHGLLKNRQRYTGFSLEDLMRHFKISAENRHDALVDCQVTAEVLRQIIKNQY